MRRLTELVGKILYWRLHAWCSLEGGAHPRSIQGGAARHGGVESLGMIWQLCWPGASGTKCVAAEAWHPARAGPWDQCGSKTEVG